ncbi:MAG: outer membrane lipoprotein chaperone LolA [Vicinamibacteraceae bacterium]
MRSARHRSFRHGLAVAMAALAVAGAALAPPVEAGPQAPAAAPAPAESAASLATRLQTRYDGIKDFTADFTQTYEGGVLRRKTTESGTLLVKKPGRMRWEYKTPDEKLFVADGRKMYAWIPADRQVTVSALPSDDAPATPILFLLGRGQLTRDFTPSLPGAIAGAPADSVALALVPKTPVPDYDRLTLVVDRATLGLRMLIARDGQGGTSTFVFSKLKENVGLPDTRFGFTIPKGADVVAQD